MAERRRAAVLGSPIGHSRSPDLHRAAYKALGLDWSYEAIEVTEGELAEFVASMDGTWAGLSLTMPLKVAVIPLLVELDPLAARLQSVNTVLPSAAGWVGTNTDVFGIVRTVERAIPGPAESAVVIGTGATARSAVAAAAELGVGQLTVLARRPEGRAKVAELARSFGLECLDGDLLGRRTSALSTADVVISTLPGAAEPPEELLAPARLARGLLVEAAYDPWPTALASAWAGRTVSGLEMLLWQACEQVRLMTGLPAPIDAMRAALSTA